MLQTVHFDARVDAVQSVLDSVARAYGYSSAGDALGRPVLPVLPAPKVPETVRQPQIKWSEVKEKERTRPQERDDLTAPWTLRTAKAFLLEVTRPSQKLLAMLVLSGEVSADRVSQYLNVTTLQGVFSTVGAAKNRIRGLHKAPTPYRRRRTPDVYYVMDDPMRELFMAAFFNTGNDRLLDDAEEFFKAVDGESTDA